MSEEDQTQDEEKVEEKTLPQVAKRIFLACKKCDCDRFHIVVSHSTTKSAKVQCEVCGGVKTYRLPSTKKTKTRKSAAKREEEKIKVLWEELKVQIGVDKTIVYSMAATYTNNSAIEHPKFGIGFVTRSAPSKIDVVFEDGPRQLVHNYSQV